MKAMRMKQLALGAALLLLAAGLSACGKRGPLDPPPAAKTTAEASRAEAEGGEVIEERKTSAEKPHEPFILDVLL